MCSIERKFGYDMKCNVIFRIYVYELNFDLFLYFIRNEWYIFLKKMKLMLV